MREKQGMEIPEVRDRSNRGTRHDAYSPDIGAYLAHQTSHKARGHRSASWTSLSSATAKYNITRTVKKPRKE